MTQLTGPRAPGFPEQAVRRRAREGEAAAFPPHTAYGHDLFGATDRGPEDALDALRLVPPVFMPLRLEKLIDLGREPTWEDVDLTSRVGGFTAPSPVYLSALGSTDVASRGLGLSVSRQAGRLGIPMVVGENVVPVQGYGREAAGAASLLGRIRAYADELDGTAGGLVVQQCTEDADAEVWNLVYSDPASQALITSGRLAFELKIGQGAKPGLGGMTVMSRADAGRLGDRYGIAPIFGPEAVLRSATPGTVTEEILRQQVRLMRNNFPRAKVWVKLPPARDVRAAALVAWEAGADAVTVDGAEGGTGWAPSAFLDDVGLPLRECLGAIGPTAHCLLVSGRMWHGARAVKSLALGATAVGLGRAALVAADEDPGEGLVRLVRCMALEMRLLISALGKYEAALLDADDVWPRTEAAGVPAAAPHH
ncbi:glutamate synthase-related protein [Sphaerisporangium rubeum]|uniref:Isopentenyl diphosphate isomerase/L-lactate dehydrogenase-like FMN-dependent dehydrogenase n=1 Tax=Sphaerisporangium rubeum TaxID=321317 RepID=A0A7X0IK66_9ACTN|nr:glutamate synthase-related protein [Sphaerisporangium rubeum]MBB6476722.1 isopentenyl diphosphate isomerase/L-lactate dehydrogenase-like FMN-dependent dehydrogenase [Sphaerisporangium rubeum]